MNFVTTTYNKILDGIQYLRDTADSTQKFIETVSAIVAGTYNFLEPIFSFLPWEVILLLIVTVILLSWINGLFPSTPKWNYTLIVCALCYAWAYTESKAYPEEGASWGRILTAAMYLLVPVHALGLLSYFGSKGYKHFKKLRKMNPKDMDSFLTSFEKDSRRLIATGHSTLIGDKEESEFLEQINELSKLLESMKKKTMK